MRVEKNPSDAPVQSNIACTPARLKLSRPGSTRHLRVAVSGRWWKGEGVSRLVTAITPQPTLVDNNCLGRNNDRFVSPSCAREIMAQLTRRRAIYAHASAGDTRKPANTPHRSSAGRLACAKTQRRNLVSLSWIRFSPTLYNMAVVRLFPHLFPRKIRISANPKDLPKISLFRRFLHALPL